VAGIILGIVALVRANREPHVYGGRGAAIGGVVASALSLLSIPLWGIVAAIAIPSLFRARVSANEAAAIGDVRTVISAQAAYAAANGGFYDEPACLGRPETCIPGYQGPSFLSAEMAALTARSGYDRTFHAGPPADASRSAQPISPSSLTSFAIVLVPSTPGRTGVRAFCGDASGQVCYTGDGSAPEVLDGMCQACQPLY
jgi:type II secretory pathway pseudopilin PulG